MENSFFMAGNAFFMGSDKFFSRICLTKGRVEIIMIGHGGICVQFFKEWRLKQ